MRQSIVGQSTYHGIATNDFAHIVCCRIALVSGLHIGRQYLTNARQCGNQSRCQLLCRLPTRDAVVPSVVFMSVSKTKCRFYLFYEQLMQCFHIYSYMIGKCGSMHGSVAIIAGE